MISPLITGARAADNRGHRERSENTPAEAARAQSSAHDDDDAGPFQDIAEAAHREPEQIAFMKAQTLDPRQTNRDQVNLNVDAEEIFENEGDRIDRRRNLQQPGRRPTPAPVQSPKSDRLEERGQKR